MKHQRNRARDLGFYILILVIVIAMLYTMTRGDTQKEYKYSEIYDLFSNEYVDSFYVEGENLVLTLKDDAKVNWSDTKTETDSTGKQIHTVTYKLYSFSVFYEDFHEIIQDQYERGVLTSYDYSQGWQAPWWLSFLPYLIIMVILMVVWYVMMTRAGGTGSVARFSKARTKLGSEEKEKKTFADVAGCEEEKEELQEIVSFLKNPKAFTSMGARIPKGVLLVGPPGTGKTLLAKAVAGEAGVQFLSISGSDFVELYVGVGASRVRDLFEQAKKVAPAIVFIDEIDAVGRQRGSGLGGGHDEREQTLNQLLVEMDGFGVNEGIIVMAATNRADILDPAILRPGRFDRKVAVSRPDVKGREEILKVHAKNKPLGDDVNLEEIARTTAGFSGADLENLLNEAAIDAAKENRAYIIQADIQKAFIKVGIGTEKKSHIISVEEKRITAYHESGHAILFHELKDIGPVYTVSIIPTGAGAAGYTMPLPGKDEMFMTRGRMLHEIMVDFGGRIAEELVLDDITTGASNDIQKATSMAYQMVTKYGMSSEIGTINYSTQEEDVFLGYDLGHEKRNSEYIAGEIDKEVRRIIESCYQDAREIILKHEDVLHASARLLMEKEKISGQEFDALFAQGSC